MAVFLLLVLILAVVLVPPAIHAHAARQEAFLVSLGSTPAPDIPRPADLQSQQVRSRRRIAGGLLVAMVATLLMGLLPTFRALLVVHLFLLDSFIAYIALLAHQANQAARARAQVEAEVEAPAAALAPARARRWRRGIDGRPAVPDLGPVISLT